MGGRGAFKATISSLYLIINITRPRGNVCFQMLSLSSIGKPGHLVKLHAGVLECALFPMFVGMGLEWMKGILKIIRCD